MTRFSLSSEHESRSRGSCFFVFLIERNVVIKLRPLLGSKKLILAPVSADDQVSQADQSDNVIKRTRTKIFVAIRNFSVIEDFE